MARVRFCVLLVFAGCLWGPVRTATTCNNLLADIVFIMDASGSVTSPNFDIMKTFVVNFVNNIRANINPNSVQMAVIRYSSSADVIFNLGSRQFADAVINEVNAIVYTAGGTNTADALNLARTSVFVSSGARSGVTKLAILMTDGMSNDKAATLNAASSLKATGARIMSIGVGDVDTSELNAVASDLSYVHIVNSFGALANIMQQLVEIACKPTCSWHTDHCWPGDCTSMLAENCQCRSGFTLRSTSDKLCQLTDPPELQTCRMTLTDAHGNEVRSRTSGTLQHCSNQQDEFMNIQPTTVTFVLTADLHQAVGTYPYYISQSQVGVVGMKVKVTKVSLSGAESSVSETSVLSQTPVCTETTDSFNPTPLLTCNHNHNFSVALIDGERLCVTAEAQGGGFYTMQDFTHTSQGSRSFPIITATRRICFTYDSTRPRHCSASPSPTCGDPPMQLSTRLTRSPDIRVTVPAWYDPVPPGGDASRVSGIGTYKLEVLGVDVANTFLSVQHNALSTTDLAGSAPYDVALTLPFAEPMLYAVLLEVHDIAGNVGYARRLLLYDNSSQIVLDPNRKIVVVSANPSAKYLWQTSITSPVCLDWRDHFYNDVFYHFDFMMPVQQDTARAIQGVYEQLTGVLPVSGTPTARGAVKFEVSWKRNNGPPSPWHNVANVTAQSVCLTIPLQDGETYDLTVRAFDVMNNTNSDDVRLHVDHTPPVAAEFGLRGRWGRTGLYAHHTTDLSTMELVVEGSDPHGGLSSIRWSVGTNVSLDDLGTRAVGVHRLPNTTSCSSAQQTPINNSSSSSDCYCPLAGPMAGLPCEAFQYNITFIYLRTLLTHQGVHHRRYYLTVGFTNNAGLVTTVPVDILVDVSPPTRGVVLEGGSSDQTEVDYTSQSRVHVYWHGFADHESGVLLYRVVLAYRCLTDAEMDTSDNATEVTPAQGNTTTFHLNSTGRYFTTVVAYNGALTPSLAACSDGIVYDTSAPQLRNVTLTHARAPRSISCPRTASGDVTAWLINNNLTRVQLDNSSACQSLCRQGNATASVEHLPLTTVFGLGAQESDDLCRSLPKFTEDSWIILPSDRLLLTWAAADDESEMEDFGVGVGSSISSSASPDLIPMTSTHLHHTFHRSHPGLGHGSIFYLFLEATSKSSLQTLLTVGPILVDSTPAHILGPLEVKVVQDHLEVTVDKGQVFDPEQPTEIDMNFSYRVGHPEGFVTPFLPASSSDVAECRRQNASVEFCARVPLASLREHDSRVARAFFFQLHVQNAAGHVTSVNSSSVKLPPMVPDVVVFDVVGSGEVTDVDVMVESDVVCMAWSDVTPLGWNVLGSTIQVEVGIGTSNSTDDVIPFYFADVSKGGACVNVTSLTPYVRLYSVIRVSVNDPNGRHSAVSASDGFVAVPRGDPDNKMQVFFGQGCSDKDLLAENVVNANTLVFNISTSPHPLHPGDVVFVALHPFVPGVLFTDTTTTLTTLTGYQVVLGSDQLTLQLPTPASSSTTVRVYACRREQNVLHLNSGQSPLYGSWEMVGPWSGLYTYLRAELLDIDCLQLKQQQNQNVTAGGNSSVVFPTFRDLSRQCLVAESRVLPHHTSIPFSAELLFEGRAYVASLAPCFDDDVCLDDVISGELLVTSTRPLLTVDDAQLLNANVSYLDLQVSLSGQSLHGAGGCAFLVSVSRSQYAAHLLSPWKLFSRNESCSSLQLREMLVVEASHTDGTLYLCVRLVFPWYTDSTLCHTITRHPQSSKVQPFHVMELSHDTLITVDLDPYIGSQQLGDRLHEAHDLDIDFARSDLLLSALVTNSGGRQITWFLMEGNRTFPGGDSCAGDPACVTTASTAPSTSNFVVYYSSSVREGAVTFSRQSSQLRHGSVYYVCAILLPRELGQGNFLSGYNEEQRVCGDGIVIDDENPVAGTVSILNGDSGYLADGGVVTVTWSGFSDVENDVTAELPDDTTLSYSVALGTYPGAEDLARFASVGQRTAWTFERLHVQSGIFCYGTVKATDRVGHVTEVTSQAVILDNTPPSVGLVRVGSILGERFVSGHELTVHWEEVADEESGIASQWVAVSMRGGHDDVIPFTKVEGTWHVLNGSDVLVDGHSYVVLIKSTNRAGLSSVTSSEPFVVDTSSPVAGAVWNGPPGSNEHLSYQTDAHTYSAHWSDFSDPHTGVQYYRAGLGTQPGQDDVAPFHYAGLRTEYTWREQLDQGREYYAVVEACNNADLCTAASSSSLLFDNSPPSSGHVIVGVDGRHTGFYGHNTTLQVRWTGFADPQSGIREFLWCVGTQPNLCDVKPIATSLLEYAVSGAVTSLPVGSPLYVTVRAINFAGLWAEGVSEKFVVDLTPPELLQPPTFTLSGSKASALRAQWDRSLVHLTWAFRDTLAPIVSTTLTLRGEVQGRHATAEPVFVGSDGHATLQLGKEDLLMDGDRYRATVVVCNAAQLCTTATSPYLLLDSTPPVVGRFEPQLRWNITIVVVSTTAAPAINTTAAPSTPSTLTNVTTATTTAAPPLTTPVTMVEVKWAEFADAESDVIAYHVTVGRSESDTDLSGGVVTVPHDSSIATQTMVLSMGNNSLTAGDLVVLCIRAENGLGLLSELLCLTFEVLLDTASGDSGLLELQRHSCVPHYCTNECTCAPTGQECTPTAGSAACTDLPSNHSSLAGWSISPVLLHRASPATFLTSAKCLEGNWTVNVQQGSPTVVRYRYSFSREGLAAGEDVMDPLKEPIWRDAGLRTSALYCLPDDRMLLSGYSYVMHLQLWLSRHTYVTVTSPALVVDLSPPFRGRGRSVNESVSSSCAGRDVDFLTQQSSVTSCWSGVFSDAQSNITRYDVWMGSTPDADDYMKIRNVGRNTSAEIDVTSMTDGTRYYVSIRAWNGAGLSTTAESDGVLRDLTAPTLGQIFLASRHAADHATDDATALPVTWHGFQDLQSGVTSYSVALYDVQDFVTPVVGFHDVGFVTKYLLKGLSLQQEHSYMAAVKARNAAGLESTSAFSAAILVDVTPPEGTGCSQFQLEAESSVPLVVNQSDFSFRPVTYSTSLTASVAKKHKLLKVMVLSTTPLPRGAEGEAVLEPHLRLPLHFRYNSSQLATADVVFLAPSSGTVNISVTVQAENGASFQARLVSCVAEQAVAPSASWSASSSSSTVNVGAIASREAVVLQQETVNKMKVTSLVIDAESEVMSLRVGLGTTPGGLQAVPLTPLGQTGHVMLEVNVPHGTQLFATLLAQNHAGTWSRFVSQPVVMDTTPPIIDQLHVTIDYVRNANGVNVTSATVLASWDAVDVGSGDVSCSCRLEGHATHDDVTQYQDVVSGGRCQWRLLKPRHDAHVRVVIGCMNGVQISTTATSQDVIVLVETPSVSQANVQFLNNYRQFSPYEHVTPDLRSSTSDLEMTWSDSGDDTVDHFRYRVLVNDVSVAGWSPLPVYKTSAIVGAGSTLPGVNVTAEVTAVNTEGVTSAVMSRTAVIDDSLPILTGKKATGSLANNELTLSWAGVFQTVHDVTFAVFAGTQDGLGNVINNAVTKDTVYRGPCDVSLAKVYVIVQAVYCNGLEETYKDVVYI